MNKLINSVNERYVNKIEELIKYNVDLEFKRNKINELNEEYFAETGDVLPHNLVYKLTDWFLSDTLKSKDVDKVTKNQYPILSKYQIKRRNKKQVAVINEKLDYLNQTRGRKEKKTTQNKTEREKV